MALVASTDGPPPNPETDPSAAQESGRPASAIRGLVGGQNPRAMMGAGQPAQGSGGPDLSGIMMLGQKLEEGLLSLAQAVPLIADDMKQAQAILINALGKFNAQMAAGSGPGGQPAPGGQPGQQPGQPAAPPTGTSVTQSGAQFPGGMSGAKPF